MSKPYHLLPTRFPKTRVKRVDGKAQFEYTRPKPDGWVTLGPKSVVKEYYDDEGKWHSERTYYKGILGPTRRRMTPGYISQRLPKRNSVGMNQAYIRRVISNPRSDQYNREVAMQYVLDNPERFIPVAEGSPDTEYGRWARIHNGDNAKHGFIKEMLELMRRDS